MSQVKGTKERQCSGTQSNSCGTASGTATMIVKYPDEGMPSDILPNLVKMSQFSSFARANMVTSLEKVDVISKKCGRRRLRLVFTSPPLNSRSLQQAIDTSASRPMKTATIKSLVHQILLRLAACHDRGIAHCNLKASDCYVCNGGKVFLANIDFQRGFNIPSDTIERTQTSDQSFGNLGGDKVNNSTSFNSVSANDMYRVGIILLQLLACRARRQDLLINVHECPDSILIIAKEIKGLKFVHKNVGMFLMSCLNQDPQKRISSRNALNHIWFKPTKKERCKSGSVLGNIMNSISRPKSGCEYEAPSSSSLLTLSQAMQLSLRLRQKLETSTSSDAMYMSKVQTDITSKMRYILINWLVELWIRFDCSSKSLFLCVNFLDRYLEQNNVPRSRLQLIGASCAFLAQKLSEEYSTNAIVFAMCGDGVFTASDLIDMEMSILSCLRFELACPTICGCIESFTAELEFNFARLTRHPKLHRLVNYLMHVALINYEMLRHPPSRIAAASIFLARHTLRMTPTWTEELAFVFQQDPSSLERCQMDLYEFHLKDYEGYSKIKRPCESDFLDFNIQKHLWPNFDMMAPNLRKEMVDSQCQRTSDFSKISNRPVDVCARPVLKELTIPVPVNYRISSVETQPLDKNLISLPLMPSSAMLRTILEYAYYCPENNLLSFLANHSQQICTILERSFSEAPYRFFLIGSMDLLVDMLIKTRPGFFLKKTDDGTFFLHQICRRNANPKTILAVLRAFPECARLTDKYGYLPLHYAISHDFPVGTVSQLIKTYPQGAAIESNTGKLPLHVACKYSTSVRNVIELINAYPSGVSHLDFNGNMPIHVACMRVSYRSLDFVEILLNAQPALVNADSAAGLAPLALASKTCFPRMCYLLLKYNADISAKVPTSCMHGYGSSPLTLAVANVDDEKLGLRSWLRSAEILLFHGAVCEWAFLEGKSRLLMLAAFAYKVLRQDYPAYVEFCLVAFSAQRKQDHPMHYVGIWERLLISSYLIPCCIDSLKPNLVARRNIERMSLLYYDER